MIVSPGCDMPMTCPWRTPLPAPQAVKNTDQCREMIKDYTGPDDSGIRIELPDYEHLEKPLHRGFHPGFRPVCRLHLYDGRRQGRQGSTSAIRSTSSRTSTPSGRTWSAARRWASPTRSTMCINGQIGTSP